MHKHNHTHAMTVGTASRALLIGISINIAYALAEVAVGIRIGSIGLVADAGHNLSDVAGLLLALIAVRLAARKATAKYTFRIPESIYPHIAAQRAPAAGCRGRHNPGEHRAVSRSPARSRLGRRRNGRRRRCDQLPVGAASQIGQGARPEYPRRISAHDPRRAGIGRSSRLGHRHIAYRLECHRSHNRHRRGRHHRLLVMESADGIVPGWPSTACPTA